MHRRSDPPPPANDGWEAQIPVSQIGQMPVSKKLWVARVLTLMAVFGFSLLGAVWQDQSMDLPLGFGPDGARRYGFYQNAGVQVWRCDDGHEHWTAPFWSGAVGSAVPAILCWLALPRRRKRP